MSKSFRGERPSAQRRRVLIVNGYLDDRRGEGRSPTTVLRAMGPPILAGQLDARRCEIRLHDEQTQGPLEDPALLGWPELLVLTGLTTGFDRMKHLAAYAMTLNPEVVVAAGGPAVRAVPRHARRFFHYACQGDVEELGEVADAVFGPGHRAETPATRYDLAPWIGAYGHVEATRYCNFRCSFCSLTAEGRRYAIYDDDRLKRDLDALLPRKYLVFIDQNLYGNDRERFLRRLDLLQELKDAGRFRGWGALVTSDFFLDEESVARARRSGCQAVFCGVESFDTASLRRFTKGQNTRIPQIELFRRALEAGILLVYGLILDVTARTLADLRAEVAFVTRCPEVTLPGFFGMPIPYPGTPFFRRCLEKDLLLPGTRFRDLDGRTLTLRPLDPVPEVAAFLRDLQTLRGHRLTAARHAARVAWRYRRHLRPGQIAMMGARDFITAGGSRVGGSVRRASRRTHVSTTEPLDAVYRPAFTVAPHLAAFFEPTYLTGPDGRLAPDVAEDLLAARHGRSPAAEDAQPLPAG